MSERDESADPGGSEKQIVVIRLRPSFGGGRVTLFHLDEQGQEAEIADVTSGKWPGQQPPDISDMIRAEVAKGNGQFIIDLAPARWLNSTGMGYLTKVWAGISRAGGFAVLTNVSDRLMDLLEITKLDVIFNISDTMDTAREFFRSPPT